MRKSRLSSVEERTYLYQRKERSLSDRVGVGGWVSLSMVLSKRMAMRQARMVSEEGRMMGRSSEMEEGGEDPGMEKVNKVDPSSKDGG